MKVKTIGTAVLSAAMLACFSTAMADEALAKKSGCLNCHGIDKKLVGPAFKDVAAKYKGDKGAHATLAASVKNGSKGKWGNVMMPPNAPRVSEADTNKLVDFVLAQQ